MRPQVDPPGPFIGYGGGSAAAARRAGRFGLALLAEGANPELEGAYHEECARAGTTPVMVMEPPVGAPTSLHVAEDVDAAWDDIGHYLLHDARAYAAWMGPDSRAASYSGATSVEELRAEEGAYQIVTPDAAVDMVRGGSPLMLQPLAGGIPPALAWRSLNLISEQVLPAIAASS